MTKMPRIILIPHWVLEIMNRNQLGRADCLDYQKIKDIMSVNDQLVFCAVQNETMKVMGVEFLAPSLAWLWSDGVPNDQSTLKQYLRNEFDRMSRDVSIKQQVSDRLFTTLPNPTENSEKNSFITYDITPNVVGVVLKPGYFTEPNNYKLQLEVIRSVLKILYMYETYHEVAKHSVYKRYLELLSMTK